VIIGVDQGPAGGLSDRIGERQAKQPMATQNPSLSSLEAEVLVIGGGSTGVGVARDAALLQTGRFLSLTLIGSGPGAIAGDRAAGLREFLSVLDPRQGQDGDDRDYAQRPRCGEPDPGTRNRAKRRPSSARRRVRGTCHAW